ncbi:MAG TPA: BON domain-containing protein [Gemmatimonadales bacterium]|nr:BON domain-containing protein [Gemmatimonadales bacterium]
MNRRSNGAAETGALIAAAGIGAALMYFLDPERGRRRRAVATDKAESLFRSGADQVQRSSVQARDRLTGVVSRTRARFGPDEPTDVQLAERVRAALGHHSNHVHDIEVVVRDGVVTLAGSVPADELQDVLRAARRVRGVNEVHDELNLHASDFAAAGQSPLG